MAFFGPTGGNRLRADIERVAEYTAGAAVETDLSSMLAGYGYGLLASICRVFGPRERDSSKDKDEAGWSTYMEKIRSSMDNVLCIYEFGCYVFHRIDLWLFLRDHGDLRLLFNKDIVGDSIAMLGRYSKGTNLNAVFDNRLHHYGTAAREDKSGKTGLHYLEQYVMRTAKTKRLEVYDRSSAPLTLSLMESTAIKIHCGSWLETMLPLFTKEQFSALVPLFIRHRYIGDKG